MKNVTTRIVLSCLLLLGLLVFACDAPTENPGIGTSPSVEADDEPVTSLESPLVAVRPCGLWIAATPALAELRYQQAPAQPDMKQFALPGGLSCSAMVAAKPAVEASWGGAAVVYYVANAPLAAPAMEWRAPDQLLLKRQPQAAGIPLLAPLAAWALSKEGLLVIGGALAWLWRKAVKSDGRRDTIAKYADEAFQVAEATGLYEKLDGKGKYRVFVQTVVDALAADKAPELSATEMQGLVEYAKRQAWIGKPAAPGAAPTSGR